jgi:hypothetical protein
MQLDHIPFRCCRAELVEQGYTPPSDAALAAVIESDSELVAALNQHYTGSQVRLDAFAREWLFETFAIYFTGALWPPAEDPAGQHAFREKLAHRVKAAGWS